MANHQGGRLTTHVLDTAAGKPAAGLRIALYRVTGNAHRKIKEVELTAPYAVTTVGGPTVRGQTGFDGVARVRLPQASGAAVDSLDQWGAVVLGLLGQRPLPDRRLDAHSRGRVRHTAAAQGANLSGCLSPTESVTFAPCEKPAR